MNTPLIAPSLLAADFGYLARDIAMINDSTADWFHIDVMDGMFVPNISFGFPVIHAIKKHAKKPLDVHLMIENPDRYLEDFKNAGAAVLTVHYEACKHLHRTLQVIKSLGMKAGVSLNPHTPVHVLDDIITETDMVLVMSVNPGFGGQHFIEQSYQKIKQLKQLINQAGAQTLIEVDGGVTVENAPKLVQLGVDILVAGSSVFKAENPAKTIEKLKG